MNVLDLHNKKYIDIFDLENDIKNFLINNYNNGNRNVTIVTGRGIHSISNKALIKPLVEEILLRINIIKKIDINDFGGSYNIQM